MTADQKARPRCSSAPFCLYTPASLRVRPIGPDQESP